jgi:putative endonuclease
VRPDRLGFAKDSEDLAAGFLRNRGYRILERNYRNCFGEIDIIARHKKFICFLEVKARRSDFYGTPQEAVSAAKQRRISRVALGYLKSKGLLDQPARFDVVGISCAADGTKIKLITGAFELSPHFTP